MTEKAMANHKRNSKMTEMFLEEVGKYSCLHNKKDKDFKDTAMKKTLWTEIGATFGITAEQAEQKWKVQRNRYTKERKLVKKSQASDNESDVYKPTWELYPILENMLDGIPSENISLLTNMKTEKWSPQHDESLGYEDTIDIEPSSMVSHGSSSPTLDGCLLTATQPNHKSDLKRKAPIDPEALTDALRSFTSVSSSLGDVIRKKQPAEDRITAYCTYLQTRLRNLTKEDLRETIKLFDDILYEKEGNEIYS